MMTLHSAKGLEFDTVFLVGLEEGILPHSRSLLNPSELSEEVRLAYVGLTRARHNLYLTYARMRRSFGNTNFNQPSRILRVLPEDQIIWKGKLEENPF
jgi:DNA helicase-2/ATP-dependent DNA helicase PcrA